MPAVHRYDDSVPTANYESFVEQAGCGQSQDAFACLVAADTAVLQNASGAVSTTRGHFGGFAFVPVVDDDYIPDRPSALLARTAVSGKRLLVGVSRPSPSLSNPEDQDSKTRVSEPCRYGSQTSLTGRYFGFVWIE